MDRDDYLAADDDALLGDCDVHTYKASGPGGQHRNKVSSAVKLKHRPTGVSAHGDDSRSQHENKRLAIKRLRMNMALEVRKPVDPARPVGPAVVNDCLHTARGGDAKGKRRLEVGRRDRRFWQVAAWTLDLLDACEGKLGKAAACIGISTGNLSRFITSERHLFTAANAIRKRHGVGPLK